MAAADSGCPPTEEGGAPPPKRMKTDAAADTTLIDAATDTYPDPVRDALASNALVALVPERSIVWDWAVAQAVTALGAIVSIFIDVMAVRIPPTYDAVMDALRYWEFDDAVPGFQAAWEELCESQDGRAVVAVCQAAATGGAVLGRLAISKMAKDPGLEDKLHTHYGGTAYLPVLLAAADYYHKHAAPPATKTVTPACPSLASLLPRGMPAEGPPPMRWSLAVAPALTALGRFVEPYISPASALLLPHYDGIVVMMQNFGYDDMVPSFDAAWEELRSTQEGRAVIAVCEAAGGVLLGSASMAREAASVPDLEGTLKKEFAGEAFLPMLLDAARYYLVQTEYAAATAAARSEGAAAAAAGAGSCE